MTTDAIVHERNFEERAHGNQQSQTVNCYEKPFEIRVDEIDINGHLQYTKYVEYCSHTRYCQLAEMGWTLDRMAAHGIGAVTLTEGIRYRLEVRLGDLIGYPPSHRLQRRRHAVVHTQSSNAPLRCNRGYRNHDWRLVRSQVPSRRGTAAPASRSHRRHPVARLHRPLRAYLRSAAGHRPNRCAASQCSTLAVTLTIFWR
jgi:hypothetical protein